MSGSRDRQGGGWRITSQQRGRGDLGAEGGARGGTSTGASADNWRNVRQDGSGVVPSLSGSYRANYNNRDSRGANNRDSGRAYDGGYRGDTGTAPLELVPVFIGDYSKDENNKIEQGNTGLHRMTIDWHPSQPKKVKFDLNQSIEKVIRKVERSKAECFGSLLEWKKSNPAFFDSQQLNSGPITRPAPVVLCFRGLLSAVMQSPYTGDEWIVAATKYRGTIYLLEVNTAQKIRDKENIENNEEQKKMCSWGLKFEHFMAKGSDPSEGHNESRSYGCMLQTHLASHSLVYGAEVDGADDSLYDPARPDLASFIELKTAKELTTERQIEIFHRHKLRKWWCQSFLGGIPRVVCGFRNDAGVVNSLQTFDVTTMPDQCKKHWSKERMLSYLEYFLSRVKEYVIEDDPNVVYKLTRPPNSSDDDIRCERLADSSDAFLPDWYVSEIFPAASD